MKAQRNKQTGEIRYIAESPLEQVLISSSNLLPTAGAIGGGVAGGFAGPVASAALGTTGFMGGDLLKNIIQGKQVTPGSVYESGKQGAGGQLLGMGIGAAGSKILGPIASKLKLNQLSPGKMGEAVSKMKEQVGKKIGELVKSKNIEVPRTVIKNTWDKIDELLGNPKYGARVDPEGRAIIGGVKSEVGMLKSLEDIFGKKQQFSDLVYNPRGTMKYPGTTHAQAVKETAQQAGGQLSDELQKLMESFGVGPQFNSLNQQYGQMSKLTQGLMNPTKNVWVPAWAAGMTAPVTGGASIPLGAAGTMVANPYMQMLSRYIFGKPLSLANSPLFKGGVSGILNYLNPTGQNKVIQDYQPQSQQPSSQSYTLPPRGY